ncbi:MAG: hypothetical protein U0528_01955 [Anaerolineae bacterium]|nr:hypothetical protein [Anaerolineae bacterium]
MSDNTSRANQPQRSSEPWELQEITALGISDDQWERMQQVERLFKEAPMVDAPPQFLDKVMLAIATKDFEEQNKPPSDKGGKSGTDKDQRRGTGLLGGVNRKLLFFMSVVGATSLVVLTTAIAVQIGLLDDLLRTIIRGYNQVTAQIADSWNALTVIAPSSVLVPGLLITGLVLLAAWAWMLNYVSARRQRVVYHIPIRVH